MIVSVTVGDVEYQRGIAQLQAAIQAAREISVDTAWHYLADIRESTERREVDDLWSIARVLGIYREILSGKVGVVVTQGIHEQYTRMFGACAERNGMTIRIFSDMCSAEEWLRK